MPARHPAKPALPPELLGLRLHGEGLDDSGLAAWFADERDGYFRIAGPAPDDEAQQPSAANDYHLFRHLPRRRFACCLALGAASGREYAGLAGRVERFVAIEPGRGFWRETIAGAPAEYRTPTLRGAIDLPDGACDLAGAFGVLHHIPNVAEVLAELARVLAPGAPLMLREPITSLGDFRRPRPGLTRNERGIPHAMMDQMLAAAGFRIRRKRFVNVPGTRELPARLGLKGAWDNPALIRLDAALARLTTWNARYWRPRSGTSWPRARRTGWRNGGRRRSAVMVAAASCPQGCRAGLPRRLAALPGSAIDELRQIRGH